MQFRAKHCGEGLEPRRLLTAAALTIDQQLVLDSLDTPTQAAFAVDVEADGDADLFLLNDDGFAFVRQIEPDEFGAAEFVPVDADMIIAPRPFDFNLDGKVDVVFGTDDGKFLLFAQDETGGFETAQEIGQHGWEDEFHAPAVRDLDGDGDLDIFGSDRWYEATGGALVEHSLPFATLDGIIDFDGDGDLDVLDEQRLGDGTQNQRISWYENMGGFTFSDAHVIFEPTDQIPVAYDIDDDSRADLLMYDRVPFGSNASSEFERSFRIYRNTGGTFELTQEGTIDDSFFFAELIDVDGDDDLDLLLPLARQEPQPGFELAWMSNDAGQLGPKRFVGPVKGAIYDVSGNVTDSPVVVSVTSNEVYLNHVRTIGDSNLDGKFDSADLITVTQRGEYEDGVASNSSFVEGDWNGDGDFDSQDLVLAFQHGHFE